MICSGLPRTFDSRESVAGVFDRVNSPREGLQHRRMNLPERDLRTLHMGPQARADRRTGSQVCLPGTACCAPTGKDAFIWGSMTTGQSRSLAGGGEERVGEFADAGGASGIRHGCGLRGVKIFGGFGVAAQFGVEVAEEQ